VCEECGSTESNIVFSALVLAGVLLGLGVMFYVVLKVDKQLEKNAMLYLQVLPRLFFVFESFGF
jgi:hypothetical protein